VDEVDGLRDLARFDLHRHAIAQQAVDGLVIAVEATAVVVCVGAQFVEGATDLCRSVTAPGQVGGEQPCLNVAVAVAVGPVAEVAVAKLIAEESDDALLRGPFELANSAHGLISLTIELTRSPNVRPFPAMLGCRWRCFGSSGSSSSMVKAITSTQ